MTPQQTDRRTNSPPLQGRGRGWGLSADSLAELHARAADMRRNPTEPEKRLWRVLCNGRLDGRKFRRQAVIGRSIADFLCPSAKLIVEVDGDTHDAVKDRLRDEQLATQGYRTVRVINHDVMTNIDGVYDHIRAALAASALPLLEGVRIKASAQVSEPVESPHPNPSPKGEGLEIASSEPAH